LICKEGIESHQKMDAGADDKQRTPWKQGREKEKEEEEISKAKRKKENGGGPAVKGKESQRRGCLMRRPGMYEI